MDVESFCWPIDTSCCAEFEDYDFDIQDRAVAFAGMTLHMLTARRVGGCPVTVRPCRADCMDGSYISGVFHSSWMNPVLMGGTWVNVACGGCGQTPCGCTALCQIALTAPVGALYAVWVDGVQLPTTAYRVDDGHMLVRVDGECWPVCQDLSVGPFEPGAFAVTYLNALPVSPLGEYAAGLLACEFAKACTGGKCRLPSGVTSITRQGISMELMTGIFPGGLTGIREVDTYVAFYNPNHRAMQTAIWTP